MKKAPCLSRIDTKRSLVGSRDAYRTPPHPRTFFASYPFAFSHRRKRVAEGLLVLLFPSARPQSFGS